MTPLLVVPEEHALNKKALREYYHEKLAPASDIDLFIYGIEDPEEAIKKMAVVEDTVKNNLLWETTYFPRISHPYLYMLTLIFHTVPSAPAIP